MNRQSVHPEDACNAASSPGTVAVLGAGPVRLGAPRTPQPNFFILGGKSHGRLNTFLLRTGYQQVDQLTAASSSGAAGGLRLATGRRGVAR